MEKFAALAENLRKIASSEQVKPAELSRLASDVFEHCGVSRADAKIAAEVALWAQLHGSDSHGIVHLPLYVRGLLDRTIKAQPAFAITQAMPCCAVLDADHGLGLVASQRAIDMAIDIAKQYGLGAVAVRNSSHFGAAGYYADRAAEQGLIGLAFTNAMPAIAPTGGTEGLLGTNPIGAAFPIPGADPVIADMATAVVARSRIRHALAAGQKSIPEGWALDPERPADDRSRRGGERLVAADRRPERLRAVPDGRDPVQRAVRRRARLPGHLRKHGQAAEQHLPVLPGPQSGRLCRQRALRRAHDAYRRGHREGESRWKARRRPVCPARAVTPSSARPRAEGIAMFGNLRSALNNVAGMLESHTETA